MKQIIQNNNNLANILVILFISFFVMLIYYIKRNIKKRKNCSSINQYSDGNSISSFKLNF